MLAREGWMPPDGDPRPSSAGDKVERVLKRLTLLGGFAFSLAGIMSMLAA